MLHCRACSSEQVEKVWELSAAPYGDLFQASRSAAQSLPLHALDLGLCMSCGLAQLLTDVSVTDLYGQYLYQTSTTNGLTEFYKRLAADLAVEAHLEPEDLVLDLGSNDGSLLAAFAAHGFRVLGVEPAVEPARVAINKGIDTKNEFLTGNVVDSILSGYGRARLVCANYVAANVERPNEFFEHLAKLVSEDGLVSILTGYHLDQFAVGMFEYINHDHLSYFTLSVIADLAAEVNLRVIHVSRVELKGGSIHILLCPDSSSRISDETVGQLLQREEWLGGGDPVTYRQFAQSTDNAAERFRDTMEAMGTSKFIGVGASVSTTHLLCQFEIGNSISFLVDDNWLKQGLYSPGFGLEVYPLSEVRKYDDVPAVLLAWQHGRVLRRRMLAEGFKSFLLTPLPKAGILSMASGA
ncbi:class I SAM-dependent methyltransferase [bacterium]|nr:class I SAM-dependent methyltransferase [bacterium]